MLLSLLSAESFLLNAFWERIRVAMIFQIYEIQTPEEAEKCIQLGVHHLGSVLLSDGEWRNPVLKEVSRLCRGAPTRP